MNAYCKSIVVALLPLVASVASAQTSAEPAPAAPPPAAAPAPAPAPPPATTARAAAPATAAHGDAASPGLPLDLSFLAGARLREVDGSADKFQEYGTVEEGFVLESLRALYQRPGTADFLEFAIRDATQDDESYRLSLGRQGRYRLFAEYDRIPHRFTGGSLLFAGVGTSRLRIEDAVQDQLQDEEETSATRGAAPFTPNPAADLDQQNIVRGLLDAGNPVGFRMDRRRVGAGLEFGLGRNALAWARVQHEDRDGARVISSGTYERFAQNTPAPVVHLADRFITAGQDLAEPLNYRTLGVSAGVGLHRQAWLADLEYTLTRFRNEDEVLRWDNPFRITSTQASGATGGTDRGRFAVGHLGLPPDSLSHDITASGAVDLPMHGRLAASVSYGIITQDQAFEPYTLGSIDTRGLGLAQDLARPQRDLDGDVRTIAASLSASVRPATPVTVGAKYRLYRYDGRSDEILFPGYSAFGDSFWRTAKNDPGLGQAGAPVRNEVFDYWRHEADLGIDYRVSRMLSVGVETGWEGWRYSHLRLDKLDEYFAGASFALRPMRNTTFKARYRFADRTNDGYLRGATAANPEARGLLNYNWADRRRHLADARVQYAPTPMVSIGVLGRFVDEDYGGETEGGTIFDEFRFGRTDVRSVGGALDVTVTPAERLAVYASYSYERRKEQMANAAKDETSKSTLVDPVTLTSLDAFSPVNYWNSDITNVVNTVAVGATFQLVPDRIVLDTRYSLSFSDMDVDTFNPNPIVGAGPTTTLDNAIARDWPTIKSRLHEVTADLGYRFTANIRAGIRYLFQEYDLDDFAWDNLDPYMAGRTDENTTRFLFADATYNAYRAHVGTVYVAGSF